MINEKQKIRLLEIDDMIAKLNAEREQINPYANLKNYPNKLFGEGWSEPHILERCEGFEKHDSKGYDFYSKALGRVEVKSCRLPATTVNQCHPDDCDYFLFALYDCEEVEDYLYLVPSADFMDFKPTVQHDRGTSNCYSMSLGTNARRELLKKYRVTYDRLSELALGK